MVRSNVKSSETPSIEGNSGSQRNQATEATYHDYSRVPAESNVSSTTIEGQTVKEPTFAMKLHMILSNPECQEIITWLPHGRSWRILQQKAFEERVIPLYFRHGRYSSFARQVNGWGFRRIIHGSDYNSYYHEMFLRGKPYLCEKMRRLTAKDLAERKKGDDGPTPDFYALSRDNPLPDATRMASVASTEPVLSRSCLESKEILNRINLLAGSKSSNVSATPSASNVSKVVKTIDYKTGVSKPDCTPSSCNAISATSPSTIGLAEAIGDRNPSSSKVNVVSPQGTGNKSLKSLTVVPTSNYSPVTTSVTDEVALKSSALGKTNCTAVLEHTSPKPAVNDFKPRGSAAPPALGVSSVTEALTQAAQPSASNSKNAPTLSAALNGKSTDAVFTEQIATLYENSAGQVTANHSASHRDQRKALGTESSFDSLPPVQITAISPSQIETITDPLPSQTTQVSTTHTPQIPAFGKSRTNLNKEYQAQSTSHCQTFPASDTTAGTASSAPVEDTATSATNIALISVSPTSKPALENLAPLPQNTSVPVASAPTAILDSSSPATTGQAGGLCGSTSSQAAFSTSVQTGLRDNTPLVINTGIGQPESSVRYVTHSTGQNTVSKPNLALTLTLGSPALVQGASNNTTCPTQSSNLQTSSIGQTATWGAPVPVQTVTLGAAPGQTATLGTANVIPSGTLGTSTVASPASIGTQTLTQGATIGTATLAPNTTIIPNTSFGSSTFAPAAHAPATLAQTSTLVRPTTFNTTTVAPNTAYGTLLTPTASPFGTTTIAPTYTLRTAPFGQAISLGASSFTPSITLLTTAGETPFTSAATLGTLPFGTFNPATSVRTMSLPPGTTLGATALSPVATFNTGSFASTANVGALSFAPATSFSAASFGQASSIDTTSFVQTPSNGSNGFLQATNIVTTGAQAGSNGTATTNNGSVHNSSTTIGGTTVLTPSINNATTNLSQFSGNSTAASQ